MQTGEQLQMSALDWLTQTARDNGLAALADGNDQARFGTLLIDGESRAGSGSGSPSCTRRLTRRLAPSLVRRSARSTKLCARRGAPSTMARGRRCVHLKGGDFC